MFSIKFPLWKCEILEELFKIGSKPPREDKKQSGGPKFRSNPPITKHPEDRVECFETNDIY